MAMPVHTGRMVIKELHTIHSHIGNTRFGIFGADHREGDKGASIGCPRGEYRESTEVGILATPHYLLTLSPTTRLARKPLGNIGQEGQHTELIDKAIFGWTMASKKGVGSSKNGRDSESKRLGVKLSPLPQR